MSKAIYGLKVRYRSYKCDCCGHGHDIQTNHTGALNIYCPNCSWKSAYDSKGNHYRADTQKARPHEYIGEVPRLDEYNPHYPLSRSPLSVR